MLRKSALAAALLLALSACASQQLQEREPEPAAETDHRMAVKTALMEDGEVAAAPIRVEFENNSIRLSGFVDNETEREHAAEVARQAVPDLQVDNALEVWRPPDNS